MENKFRILKVKNSNNDNEYGAMIMKTEYEATVIKIFLLNFIVRLYDQWITRFSFFANGLNKFLNMIIGT